mgnify:FL=1
MTEFENLISEHDLAALRGVTVRTLQRERAQRRGPAFIKLGRKVYYRREAVNEWLRALEEIPVRSETRERA